MRRLILLCVAAVALSACKADRVRVDLGSGDLEQAVAGQTGKVRFTALIEEKHTKIDDEKRSMIKAVEASILEFFSGAEVDVSIASDGYAIEVEGELDIASEAPTNGTPWFVSVRPAQGFDGGALVSLEAGSTFERFSGRIGQINRMFAPDRFQPVEFRLRAEGAQVIVGGAVLNGEAVSLRSLQLGPDRISINLADGVWDDVAPGFVYRP